MILSREFVNKDHTHRFTVTPKPAGWEVREEEDSVLLHCIHRDDWHRVERDGLLFGLTASALLRRGWRERADCEAA